MQSFRSVEPILRRELAKDPNAEDHASRCIIGFWGTLGESYAVELHADSRDLQETLNYWKQLPHILKYFRAEEDPNARRPQNFMSGFLEVS
jgi:hypothetical protein